MTQTTWWRRLSEQQAPMSELPDHPAETPSEPWLELLDGLVEDVLGLIGKVWKDISGSAATLTEPDITLAILGRLRPALANRLYTVHLDDPGDIGLELTRGMGKSAKKIDLVMCPHHFPDRYYPIEAKVLVGVTLENYTPQRQAEAYVLEGISRFVTGAYRAHSGRVAMLGYVLRGPESNCLHLINEQLASTGTPTTNQLSKQGPGRYLSAHPRQHSDVRIDHLWLKGSA